MLIGSVLAAEGVDHVEYERGVVVGVGPGVLLPVRGVQVQHNQTTPGWKGIQIDMVKNCIRYKLSKVDGLNCHG